MKGIQLLVLFILFTSSLSAQLIDDMEDEGKLYAESKQVNQFFRRFNGEEDEKGNRYYANDKNYRNPKLRKKYLGLLFDDVNTSVTTSLKVDFAKHVLDKGETALLDFHGPNWFSEVHTVFTHNGKDQSITLFMELEKSHQGYKWVIQKVHADMFDPYYTRDTLKVGQFLHPLSHELDFMNMRKAFLSKDSIQQFTARRFMPDHLSLFVYETKKRESKIQISGRSKISLLST